MVYRKVIEKLDELEDLKAVGFPDGSIDTYIDLEKGKEGEIKDRLEVAERIQENSSASFRALPNRIEPGGKSFNMSAQHSALGLETSHYGFLDHKVFEQIDFKIYSMGSPAEVTIAEFDNGSLLIAEHNPELIEWELEDLREFGDLDEILSADIVCCANWATVKSMNSELEKISGKISARVFSFDPGNLEGIDGSKIREMFEALEKISDKCEVLVHANTDEVEKTAEIYGLKGEINEKIDRIQQKTGVDAYILHDKQKAVAGTERGVIEVENLVTDHVETRTGAGDRFDAGVSAGRTAGWNWEESLALGNLCAVQYVENNETATPETIRKQVEDKLE
jgi:hypothetical protein